MQALREPSWKRATRRRSGWAARRCRFKACLQCLCAHLTQSAEASLLAPCATAAQALRFLAGRSLGALRNGRVQINKQLFIPTILL